MAEFKRFFVDEIGESVVLCGEEFEHAKNVLRLSVGDEVILLDNSGYEYNAEISCVEKRSMTLYVLGKTKGDNEPKTPVT